MFDLSSRVAVVIGATSGIGRCLAFGLADSGATVIPTGRRANELKEVCEGLSARGRDTIHHVADVRDRSSLESFHAAVIERFGHVDVLVNAAGYTSRQATASMSEEQWAALLDTNVTGTLRGCQVFYQSLRASGSGRIINIASLGAFVAFQEVAAYCASKAAVLSLTKSLACEWALDGICVNALAPGIIPTDLNDHVVTGTSRGEEMLLRTPMRRFGKSEELLGAALLLASAGSSFLTGQCIVVDGGYLASGVNQ
jgi:NAD(P)-dependent dehydrogenase (short-subunit alcohol dehydrogenase family)